VKSAGALGRAVSQGVYDLAFGRDRPWYEYVGRAALNAVTGTISAIVDTAAFILCLPSTVGATARGAAAGVGTWYLMNQIRYVSESRKLGWGSL